MSGRRQQASITSSNLNSFVSLLNTEGEEDPPFSVVFSSEEYIFPQSRVHNPRLLWSISNFPSKNNIAVGFAHFSDKALQQGALPRANSTNNCHELAFGNAKR